METEEHARKKTKIKRGSSHAASAVKVHVGAEKMATTPPESDLIPQQKADPMAPPEGKVFLGGLGPDMNENDLKEYFTPYGTLCDVVVMRDRVTRNGRGFGCYFIKQLI